MVCSECGANNVTRTTCPYNPDARHPKPRLHSQSGGSDTKPKLKLKSPYELGHTVNIEQAKRDAKRYPGKEDEFVADVIAKLTPMVPSGSDGPSQLARREMEKTKELRASIDARCKSCLKYINARNSITDSKTWGDAHTICTECYKAIKDLHDSDLPDNRTGYAQYHGKELPVGILLGHGAKNAHYNATMYEGSKFWAGVAKRRGFETLATPPTKLPK
jgi:hypothetical protein